MPTTQESQETPDVPMPVEGRCPRCGAAWRPGGDKCWLCYLPAAKAFATESVELTPVLSPPIEPVTLSTSFSLASLLMVITLVSVVFGVSTFAPGVGIPLGVVLLVVWLKTAERAERRRKLGHALTWTETTQLFFASFGAALAMIAVVCAAGAKAFAVA